MSPRPPVPPPDDLAQDLRAVAVEKAVVDARLKEAVFAAIDAGGSVREVARLGQIAPSTVQLWIRDRLPSHD
jgi:hypothetical protein